MPNPNHQPTLCIKPVFAPFPYICGLCGDLYGEEITPQTYVYGKVYIDGTDSPVCLSCCEVFAPYLQTLCDLEFVMLEYWENGPERCEYPEALLPIFEVAKSHHLQEGEILEQRNQRMQASRELWATRTRREALLHRPDLIATAIKLRNLRATRESMASEDAMGTKGSVDLARPSTTPVVEE